MGLDDAEWRRQHPLLVQLRELSRKEGLWRDDLRSFFAAELPDLCVVWKIDLHSMSSKDIRDRVRSRLMEHFGDIPTPAPTWKKNAGKRTQQFLDSFRAGFNLYNERNPSALNRRQNRARVSPRMATRDLAYACEQIEKQILKTGYQPIFVAELVEPDPAAIIDNKEEKAPSSDLVVLHQMKRDVWRYPSEPPIRARKVQRLSAVAAVIVVIAGVGITLWHPWSAASGNTALGRDSSTPSVFTPSASGTSSSTPAMSTTALASSAAVPPLSQVTGCTLASPGAGDVPFTCTIKQLDNTCGKFKSWITTKSPEVLSQRMPTTSQLENGWRGWPEVADGVAGSPGLYEVVLQGKNSATVTLTEMRAIVDKKRPPIQGFSLNQDCGGDGIFRTANYDLDKTPPKLSPFFDPNAAGPDAPTYELKPLRLPYRVALTDPETFWIEGTTVNCDCDWHVEISWSSQGKTGQVRIDDNGKLFRTSSTAKSKTCYLLDTVQCQ